MFLCVCVIFLFKQLIGAQHSDDGKILFRILGTPDVLPKGDEKAKNLLIDFVYDYATTG